MPVRGSNNALRSFRTLYAKDLLKAPSLHFISSLLELVLTLRFSCSFLLKYLHKFHVELVSSSHDDLFGLCFGHLASLTRGHHSFALRLISLRHNLRYCLNFWSSLWHETAARLTCLYLSWLITKVLLVQNLLLWLRWSNLTWCLWFIKLLNRRIPLVLLTGSLAIHAWFCLSISMTCALNRRSRHHLVEFFFADSEFS